MTAPIPVTIISGFLGAGKTTLLGRILRDPQGIRYGVLVNDFASINIDAALIADAGPDRISLANGCVCCTIRDDLLAAAFAMLRGDPAPEHIVIETSGVANPRAVADAFVGDLAASSFTIDAIFCLIDALNVMDLDFTDTELAIDQAAGADVVLLNKCDLAGETSLAGIETMLRDAQPTMRIVRTVDADLPRAVLTGRAPRAPTPPRAPTAHHDHGTLYKSWSWQSPTPLTLPAFQAAIKTLPAAVLRAKGILSFVDAPGRQAVFQLVGRRSVLDFRDADPVPAVSSLVAIGRARDFDAAQLDRHFAACVAPHAPSPALPGVPS